MKGKHTVPIGNLATELSRKRVEGVGERARTSNRVTQHQVREGWEVGVSTMITTSRQCWDWSPKEDKVDQGDPHTLQHGILVMGDGCREHARVFYCHCL